MKRSNPGKRNSRAAQAQQKPVVKHRTRTPGRTRTGPAATRAGASWTADELNGDDAEGMENLDLQLPPAIQDPALAARRRIEQLREERWLHDALDDFTDS